MPGSRVISVSVWAEPSGESVMCATYHCKDGTIREAGRSKVSEAAVYAAALILGKLPRGSFRPFLGGCPGWVWEV